MQNIGFKKSSGWPIYISSQSVKVNLYWEDTLETMKKICDRPPSLGSLCGSVVEHWSTESEGLRFDSSSGVRIFSLSYAHDKTKNIFLYFFTELKIYHLSYFNEKSVLGKVLNLHVGTGFFCRF